MAGGGGSSYGRGGPASYGNNMSGIPPYIPPPGRFNVGHGGGGSSSGHRGLSGRLGSGHVGDRKDDVGRHGGGRDYRGGRFGGDRNSGGRGRGFGGASGGGRGGGRHGGSSKGDLDNVSLPKQDFRNLVPFEKNFYVESSSVRAMSEHDVMAYRASREITVQGSDVPRPVRTFQDANFPGELALL